ncbi:hypothetical protein DFJ73DRAFT_759144 [Zopfochytrium polystomum]|nr:hypothetical protein DFJ73DRAFT_759144 [Zopfochytrium polystomum]
MPANSFDSSSSSTPPPPTDVVDPSLSNSSVGRGNAIYQSPPPVPAKPLQSSPLVRPPSIASAQDDLPTQERALGQKEKSNSPPLASPVIASPAVSSSEVPSSQLPIESSNTVPLFAAASPEMSPAATFRSLQAPQSAPVQASQNHPVATPISLQQLTTVPNTATDPTAVSATLTGTATDSPTRANSNAPMASALALYSKSDASGIISPTSGSAAVRAADAERVALDAKREGKWRAMVVDQRGFRTASATPVPGGEGEGWANLSGNAGTGRDWFGFPICKVGEGPPSAWRGYVWYHLFTESATSDAVTAANAFDAQLIGEFHAKQTMSCIYDEEIELDAQNALANHVHFMTKDSSGQRGIRRVLNAFTQRDVEFGYNSAMVKIAAMLLLNMEEERAYIALVHLYHPVDTVSSRFGLRSLHASGLAGLPELLFLHDELIKVYAPRLRAKFASSRLKTIQYATHCMQELDQMYSELERLLSSGSDLGVSTRGLSPALVMATFDSLLPFRVLVRLWDLFALYGYEILAVIGVALLRKHEAFLMTLERDDIISFFLPSSTPFVLRRLRRAARNKTASSSSASSTHSSLPRVPLPFHFAGARSPSPARSLASPTPPSPTPYESGNGDAAAPDGSTGTFSRSAVAAAAAAAAAAALDAPPPSGTGASASSSAAAAFVHVPPVWAPDADEPFIQLVLAIWNGSAAAIQHPGAAPAASSSGGAGNAGSQNAGLPPPGGEWRSQWEGRVLVPSGWGWGRRWRRAGGKVLVRQMREAYDSSGVKLGMLVGGAEEMRKNVR